MKLSLLIAACMAIVAVQSATVDVDKTVFVADKSFLEKQGFIFDMLLRVDKDLMIEKWIKVAGNFITDKTHYTKYNEWMDGFYGLYKAGSLIPRGDFSSPLQRNHAYQEFGLFNIFYYSKDWETLMHNIAWARLNVNEGIFVHALSLAVIHRKDMEGVILPQIHEIFPQMFFAGKYIAAAQKFDWDTWNRQIMLEKELKTVYDQEYPNAIFGKRFYLKDWKLWQWWKLMGLDDGWHLEDAYTSDDSEEEPVWSSIYKNLKEVWLPVDYTRDIGIFNEESKLSYFTEDVRWNTFWYNLNMDNSYFLWPKEFHLNTDRCGEWWIFNVQQLLARYNMERFSQGLGAIDTLSWYGVHKNGYDPYLVSTSGNGYSFRKNYWQVEQYQNIDVFNKFISIEHRLDDAIATGKFVLTDGTVIDLTLPESIDFVGRVMQGHIEYEDRHLIGYWLMLSAIFLNGQAYHDFKINPSVLMNYETMLRDPMTYNWFDIIVKKFYKFKDQLEPYTRKELLMDDVKIVNVETSKFTTYFELADFDVSTLSSDKLVFNEDKLVWDKSLLFRQSYLECDEFNFTIAVTSKKAQPVVISVFLGPEFDEYGRKLMLSENREKFMQIDKFVFDLSEGMNSINRSSEDFTWTAGEPHGFSELYNYFQAIPSGEYQINKNISTSHSLFPNSLVLPHGWVEGMPMGLFFMISPYKEYTTNDSSYSSGVGSGMRFVDNLPFGYPLDRKIENFYQFYVPNMYYKTVKIYHLEKYHKYYPTKYEHYGSFDVDY